MKMEFLTVILYHNHMQCIDPRQVSSDVVHGLMSTVEKLQYRWYSTDSPRPDSEKSPSKKADRYIRLCQRPSIVSCMKPHASDPLLRRGILSGTG